MTYFKSFLAGFLSTLLFHQSALLLMGLLSTTSFHAYSFEPTSPLGIPAVLSTSFFAGLWGLVIWKMIERLPHKNQLIMAIILGAILPTAVAFLIVLPLKGIEFKSAYIPFGLLLNGIWGFGLWFLVQAFNKLQRN